MAIKVKSRKYCKDAHNIVDHAPILNACDFVMEFMSMSCCFVLANHAGGYSSTKKISQVLPLWILCHYVPRSNIDYPLVIKQGSGKSPMNIGLHRNITELNSVFSSKPYLITGYIHLIVLSCFMIVSNLWKREKRSKPLTR